MNKKHIALGLVFLTIVYVIYFALSDYYENENKEWSKKVKEKLELKRKDTELAKAKEAMSVLEDEMRNLSEVLKNMKRKESKIKMTQDSLK
tara:strand:+ start:2991 stop:3263 length:273 start_codon:yes stop_codon:yes gene_type:complete